MKIYKFINIQVYSIFFSTEKIPGLSYEKSGQPYPVPKDSKPSTNLNKNHLKSK